MKKTVLVVFILLVFGFNAMAQVDMPLLENPMSVKYLKKHLEKNRPRLVLNPKNEKILKKKLKSDPVVQNVYKGIKYSADNIYDQPLLERVMTGKRLLSVSRRFLNRMNMLGMVYYVEKDKKALDRIDQELQAVCSFTDWNPSHFLDVSEMALGVALALDWTDGDLPQATIDSAHVALIKKGLMPSFEPGVTWIYGINNWNQVCHCGMVAAAIEIAEIDPELASNTISRALDNMPHALKEYGADGVYPEGATYWGYGTGFTVMTAAMLQSALGTDFGLADYRGLKESAMFKVVMEAPSGQYFNYGDCGDYSSKNGDIFLAWFAVQTGNGAFYQRDRFLRPAKEMGGISRLGGAGLVWLSQFNEKSETQIPNVFADSGRTPVVVFQGGKEDPRQFYLATKGGRAGDNHGNMDIGSFVFELDGERWVVDPGNQDYYDLEKTGFDLWSHKQGSQRWTLLTKGNHGHSTITVNDLPHQVDGRCNLLDLKTGDTPAATLDMQPTLGAYVKSAERTFIQDTPASLTIKDQIALTDSTESIVWQLITKADVEIVDGGAVLTQNGKSLKLETLSHPELMVSVISLYPAPMELDKQIEGLKRIEIRIPAYTVKDDNLELVTRLSGI